MVSESRPLKISSEWEVRCVVSALLAGLTACLKLETDFSWLRLVADAEPSFLVALDHHCRQRYPWHSCVFAPPVCSFSIHTPSDDWHAVLLLLSCLQCTARECFCERLWNSFPCVVPTEPPNPGHLSVASPFFLEVPRFYRIEQITCSYGVGACYVYSVWGKSDKNKVCRSKPKIYVYWRS